MKIYLSTGVFALNNIFILKYKTLLNTTISNNHIFLYTTTVRH